MVFVLSVSLVLAAQVVSDADIEAMAKNAVGNANVSGKVSGNASLNSEDVKQAAKELANNSMGEKIRERIKTKLENGEQVRLNGAIAEKVRNQVRLKAGNVSARTNLSIYESEDGGIVIGKNAQSRFKVKVMPDVASEMALERLRLKNCNKSNNCSIELKAVGEGNQTRGRYEVRAKKKARIFGLFETNMNVEAEVDAETGEVVRSNKPWWAFLAIE